jgi:DNA-binding MarR family transcriptional regulator
MAAALERAGYADYRRTDAALVRLLARGPQPIGRLGAGLDVTRQAARKLVTGLERRGYATVARDEHDARQLNVSLTPRGQAYAEAVIEVIVELNRRVAEQVEPSQLAAADAVLRATLPDAAARERAARLIPPPAPQAGAPPGDLTG